MIDSMILGFMDSDPLTLLLLSLLAGAVVVGIVKVLVALWRRIAKL
jgi:hypothetical protein